MARVDDNVGGQLVPRLLDKAIATLADAQWGVVSRRQLLAAELSARMIDHRVATARLALLHRGVYAFGHRRLRREGHWMAAVLAGGDGAVLSHRSAAALWEIGPLEATRIDVTVRARRTRAPTEGVRWHTTRSLRPDETRTHRGIPTTTPARTMLDVAEVATPRELERARDRARQLYLDAHVEPRHGRHGSPTLDAVKHHEAGTTVTKSELEEALLALTRRAQLPPPRLNAHVEGRERDAVWPAQRLVVELDSRKHHLTFAAFEDDRARDAELVIAGWRVLRITHLRITREPEVVARQVAALLGA